jgi:hypothetical protein
VSGGAGGGAYWCTSTPTHRGALGWRAAPGGPRPGGGGAPPLLLLDEPLSALDPGLRARGARRHRGLQERYRPGHRPRDPRPGRGGRMGHRVGIVMDGRSRGSPPRPSSSATPAASPWRASWGTGTSLRWSRGRRSRGRSGPQVGVWWSFRRGLWRWAPRPHPDPGPRRASRLPGRMRSTCGAGSRSSSTPGRSRWCGWRWTRAEGRRSSSRWRGGAPPFQPRGMPWPLSWSGSGCWCSGGGGEERGRRSPDRTTSFASMDIGHTSALAWPDRVAATRVAARGLGGTLVLAATGQRAASAMRRSRPRGMIVRDSAGVAVVENPTGSGDRPPLDAGIRAHTEHRIGGRGSGLPAPPGGGRRHPLRRRHRPRERRNPRDPHLRAGRLLPARDGGPGRGARRVPGHGRCLRRRLCRGVGLSGGPCHGLRPVGSAAPDRAAGGRGSPGAE